MGKSVEPCGHDSEHLPTVLQAPVHSTQSLRGENSIKGKAVKLSVTSYNKDFAKDAKHY